MQVTDIRLGAFIWVTAGIVHAACNAPRQAGGGCYHGYVRLPSDRILIRSIRSVIICQQRRFSVDDRTINFISLLELLQKQNFKCQNCPRELFSARHLDHIIPVASGGPHTIANVQWLCIPCHKSKHNPNRSIRHSERDYYFDPDTTDPAQAVSSGWKPTLQWLEPALVYGGAHCKHLRAEALLAVRFANMNKLHIGFSKDIDLPNSGGFLFIDDEIPKIARARIFDVEEHSFNPLRHIDYRTARDLAVVLYSLSPQGENTLTVRNGKRALLQALLRANRLNRIEGDEEITAMIDDLLISPVLKRVLCNPENLHNTFSFNPRSVILARINRAELGEFDALVLGQFLIAQFKGQIVIPDFGFYGRDAHVSLIRQNRLIAGVNYLDELPLQLRRTALSVKDRVIGTALFDDAVLLAKYEGLTPTSNGFNDFVDKAIA